MDRKTEVNAPLAESLDNLLERYLITLDEYQRLRMASNEHLSAGFISLAQANFSNHNRIRYGQDYYDDRMEAQSRVTIDQSTEGLCAFATNDSRILNHRTPNQGSEDVSDASDNDLRSEASELEEKTPAANPDPIRWFGGFIPQALRSSQGSFESAVMHDLPRSASLSNEMKNLEIEIRRARKKIRKLNATT